MTNPYTEITQQKLIINQLTKQQYDGITPNANELYMVTDEYPVDDATNSTKGIVKPDNTSTTVNNGTISAYTTNVLDTVENLIPTDISENNTYGFTVSASMSTSEVYFSLQENATYPRWQVNANAFDTPHPYFQILFPSTYSLSYFTVENYSDDGMDLLGRIVKEWQLEYTTDGGTTWTTCYTQSSAVPQVIGLVTFCNLTQDIQNVNGIRFTCLNGGLDDYSSVGRVRFYGKKNKYSLQNSINTNLQGYKADKEYMYTNLKNAMRNSGYLSKPSTRTQNLTLGASGATYTAPANGWVEIQLSKPFAIASESLVLTPAFLTGLSEPAGFIPVSQGETIAVYYNNSPIVRRFTFIYDNMEGLF